MAASLATAVNQARNGQSDWQPCTDHDLEQRERQKMRIRARYAQRDNERKVQMYYQALEIVRAREMEAGTKRVCFSINFSTHVRSWDRLSTLFRFSLGKSY